MKKKFNSIYLDNNATTPIFPEVADLIFEYLKNNYGNSSSIHSFGQKAREILTLSRMKLGTILNAKPEEIIWTSSGTESNNLAILGFLSKYFQTNNKRPHIITSQTEHKSILEVLKAEKLNGSIDVTYLPVNNSGLININTLLNTIQDNTILISIMLANNETGTIQNIKSITSAIRAKSRYIAIHTDAVQGFGKIPIDVKDLGIDMLSISSHKINGPKGVGALFLRRGCKINSIIKGGSHEWNLRAGTENIPAIGGFALAADISSHLNKSNIMNLRDCLENKILKEIPNTQLNGDLNNRLSNTSNISFKGIEAVALLTRLDMESVAVSTGSACSSGTTEPSYTLRAMGIDSANAYSAIRFSLGYQNTQDDIDYTFKVIKKIVKTMRTP